MSEETILKSSMFGGYKKEDVINYIDSVSEQNDKKAKEMEEQIVHLTKENNMLKKQLTEAKKQSNNAHYLLQDTNNTGNQKEIPVRQQMELPEGTYLLSNDHSVIHLPEPSPAYQTKEKSTIEDETSYENVPDVHAEIAATEQTENSKNIQDKYIGQNEAAAYSAGLNSEGIRDIQAELASVKSLLEKEKNEKQMLAAKLEFCNELLLKLYKK